ncbi:MAG: hypothetical protein AB4041_02400 [Microcystaceae cyanobacterium]
MTNLPEKILDVYLQEYNQLKTEQTARIGFRDNLLYVTLAAQGAIFSFIFLHYSTNSFGFYPLLLIPFICLILGWAYLINDDKISEIGRYLRTELSEKIIDCTQFQLSEQLQTTIKENLKTLDNRDLSKIEIVAAFGWEVFHRSDQRRQRRKIQNFFIDEFTFVISGIGSLVAFWFLVSPLHWMILSFSLIQLLFLIILAVEIFLYADFDFGK